MRFPEAVMAHRLLLKSPLTSKKAGIFRVPMTSEYFVRFTNAAGEQQNFASLRMLEDHLAALEPNKIP